METAAPCHWEWAALDWEAGSHCQRPPWEPKPQAPHLGRQEKRLSQWGDSRVQGSSLGRAVTQGSWAGILGEGGRQLPTASRVA